MTSSEDERSVEALASDRAYESLGDCVRPRRPDGSLDDSDVLCGEDGVEGSGEFCVSVTDRLKVLTLTGPSARV